MPSPAGKGDREAVDEVCLSKSVGRMISSPANTRQAGGHSFMPPSGREGDREAVEGASGYKSREKGIAACGYGIAPTKRRRNRGRFMNRSYAKTVDAMPFVTNGNAATPGCRACNAFGIVANEEIARMLWGWTICRESGGRFTSNVSILCKTPIFFPQKPGIKLPPPLTIPARCAFERKQGSAGNAP